MREKFREKKRWGKTELNPARISKQECGTGCWEISYQAILKVTF